MTSPLRLLLQPSQITNENHPPTRTHTRTHVVTLVTIVTSN